MLVCMLPPPLLLLLLPHQGEGEEEETDDLIGQVLDEIGISTTTQVRSSSWSTLAACVRWLCYAALYVSLRCVLHAGNAVALRCSTCDRISSVS
jgi:hypothetical protein